MPAGIYTTLAGEIVKVGRTDAGGYMITYPDGRVVVIGGSR